MLLDAPRHAIERDLEGALRDAPDKAGEERWKKRNADVLPPRHLALGRAMISDDDPHLTGEHGTDLDDAHGHGPGVHLLYAHAIRQGNRTESGGGDERRPHATVSGFDDDPRQRHPISVPAPVDEGVEDRPGRVREEADGGESDACHRSRVAQGTQDRTPTAARAVPVRPPFYGGVMADGWYDVTPAGDGPWEGLAPGPELARALADADPRTLPAPARVSYLAATERLAGWVHLRQAHALVAVADAVTEASPAVAASSFRESCIADEIAAALHIAPRTARFKIDVATALVRFLPRLGARVEQGLLTAAQAREIAQGVVHLAGRTDDDGSDLAIKAADTACSVAADLPPARLRERVARIVMRLDPVGAAQQRQEATRDLTDVSIWSGTGEREGLAVLAARGPAPDLIGLRAILDARARELRRDAAPDDERTVGQWRHAALLAAFGLHPHGLPSAAPSSPVSIPTDSGAAGSTVPVRPTINVTVPLGTLLGLDDTPGHLEGFGPIDPELARSLAADGDWVRWLTDPAEGFLLDEGRRRFPGSRLARFLRARERRCKHPACSVPSNRCDADHLPAYADGGRTSASTMSPTCPRHNRHRGPGGWTIRSDEPHNPAAPPHPLWISPLGRHYRTTVPQALHDDDIPQRL